MGTLNKGEVAFAIDGVDFKFAPTLAAFSNLADQYGTLLELWRKTASGDIPTLARVISAGLGVSYADAQNLLLTHGYQGFSAPAAEYVFRLFNGGKSPEEINAAAEADTSGKKPGNVAVAA